MEEAYAKVPTNIIVVYGPRPTHEKSRKNLADLALQHDAIVLHVWSSAKGAGARPYYADYLQKQGSSFRTTPFTPFALLHRLGDAILDKWWDTNNKPMFYAFDKTQRDYHEAANQMWERACDARNPAGMERARSLLYNEHKMAGINTAAGRLYAFDDWDQAMCDLFAKYLITGKIAYNPPESLYPFVNKYYAEIAGHLPELIQKMVSYLRPGSVFNL
jgi:hypothetical protein